MNATEEVNRWERPTGFDASQYKGHKRWSGPRWAWEFLRRNPAFQRECLVACTVAGADDQEAAIAERFQLAHYKPFWESYSEGKKPRFRAEYVRYEQRVTEDAIAYPKRRLMLRPNDVCIRFEVGVADNILDASIHAQLERARRILNRAVAERRAQNPGTKPKKSRVRVDRLLPLVRLLDVIAHTESVREKGCKLDANVARRGDQYLRIFGGERGNSTGDKADLPKKFNAKKQIADRYASSDYLVLATRSREALAAQIGS